MTRIKRWTRKLDKQHTLTFRCIWLLLFARNSANQNTGIPRITYRTGIPGSAVLPPYRWGEKVSSLVSLLWTRLRQRRCPVPVMSVINLLLQFSLKSAAVGKYSALTHCWEPCCFTEIQKIFWVVPYLIYFALSLLGSLIRNQFMNSCNVLCSMGVTKHKGPFVNQIENPNHLSTRMSFLALTRRVLVQNIAG